MDNNPEKTKLSDFSEYEKKYQDKKKEQLEWEASHRLFVFFSDLYDLIRYQIPYFLEEMIDECKYGLERMFKGYDRRIFWDYSEWHSEKAIMALTFYRDHSSGYHLVDELTPEESENDDLAKKKWIETLDIIIDGFKAIEKIQNNEHQISRSGEYIDNERSDELFKEWFAQWEKGMKLYTKYYLCFWD